MECNNLLRIVIKDYIKPEFFSRVKENTEEDKMKYLKEMGKDIFGEKCKAEWGKCNLHQN